MDDDFDIDKRIALIEVRFTQLHIKDVKFFIDDIQKEKIKHDEAIQQKFKEEVVYMLNQYFDGKCKPI